MEILKYLKLALKYSTYVNAPTFTFHHWQNYPLPLTTVNLPAADIVQEGELSVHQAGQEGDLSIRTVEEPLRIVNNVKKKTLVNYVIE